MTIFMALKQEKQPVKKKLTYLTIKMYNFYTNKEIID